MIKVQATDTIVDIVNKIKNDSNKELILEFPFGHPVLHNYLSLKILKNKADSKRITILTSDISSTKIGKPIGIYYSIIKDAEFIKEKSKKQEILKHNFTFFEFLIFELKKYYKRFNDFIFSKSGINNLKCYSPQERIRKSGIMFLIIGVVTSLSMLLFIFYFAVNRTFIDIIPEIDIQTKAINIVYQSEGVESSIFDDDIKIDLREIKGSVSLEQQYNTTGIDYGSTSKAKGNITFINELKSEQVFRPDTRLLTEDGLIFLTDDWVRIPGRTVNGSGETIFGKADMNITARLNDNSGNFIGKKGNIKGDIIMTIPGLNFNQDKIYAKLNGETSGGGDNVDYYLSETDLSNAKENFTERLKKEAFDHIKNKIIEENRQNNIDYDILGVNNIINYSDLDIYILDGVNIGDRITNFKIGGSIKINTYIYNRERVIRILRNLINDSILTGTQKLMFIDELSLRTTEVVDRQNDPLSIKITTEIDKGLAFDFDNDTNNYNQRLKMQILGLSKEEAKGILLNDEKIRNVIIRNKPFFLNNITGSMNNIIMRIVD